jgi:hypothetical protein
MARYDDGLFVIKETIVIQGWVAIRTYGDEGDTEVIYVSDDDSEPLAERLSHLSRQRISVRYWTSNQEAPIDVVKTEAIKTLMGYADIDFGARYSEITGYLWTDNDLNVGGRDLLRELESASGKWLVLEVDVEDVHATRQQRTARSLDEVSKDLLVVASDPKLIPYEVTVTIKMKDENGRKGESLWRTDRDGALSRSMSGAACDKKSLQSESWRNSIHWRNRA